MNLLFQAAQQARLIRERQELIFWTTAGPTTTFDPKITGVAGTWFFDDGTTLAASSGSEISKTFAAGGLHRAVYRPASGGLAAITMIDCSVDLVIAISMRGLVGCKEFRAYTNPELTGHLSDLPAELTYASFYNDPLLTGDLSDLPAKLTIASFSGDPLLTGDLSDLPAKLTTASFYNDPLLTGDLSDLPAKLEYAHFYGDPLLTAASVAHLTVIRDIRIYSMGWLTADVDTVINSMWAARAKYTYATPALQIGGTNQAPTGNVIAPIEGADWHQDGATWIPLTAGAKIYDLANNVNSEVRPSWAITYTS